MHVLSDIGSGLDEAFFMLWDTLWALVLGFTLSGAVQAFVSRGEMQRVLGDHRPRTLARSSVFGVISSSCSYASSALAKSLFARGADFTAAIVFMIASTNLVVELGIVLWLLIGWQFALAEFVGGAIMIVLLGLVVPRVIPAGWIEQARTRLETAEPATADHEHHSHQHHEQQHTSTTRPRRNRLAGGCAVGVAGPTRRLHGQRPDDAAQGTRHRLRRRRLPVRARADLVLALDLPDRPRLLVQAGERRARAVPRDHQLRLLGRQRAARRGAVAGRHQFGGVVAFVFADLITLPLLAIYRKYYGTAIAVRLLAVLWATMTVAGLAVEYLFRAVGIHDPARPTPWCAPGSSGTTRRCSTSSPYRLRRRLRAVPPRDTSDSRFAKDPVCGMQVEIANAPASRTVDDATFWFCSDHCAHRFDADHPL